MNITNVSVELGPNGASAAVMCECGGFRYHVWCAPDGSSIDPPLYKNAPLGIDVGDPDYFYPRKLSVDSKFGNSLIEAMMCIADSDGLFEKAGIAYEARCDAEQRERDEAKREHCITRAAMDLYVALKAQEEASAFASACSDAPELDKVTHDKADQLFDRAASLRHAAIAKAEGR